MIIGVIGKIGSGKTLFATMLAYYYFKRGNDVISNYKLNFRSKRISYDMLLNYSKTKYEMSNKVIVLDEVHIYLDSRGSGSNKKNKIISYFITQTRKRNVILIYTTQKLHLIDKRLRGLTDYFIKAEKINDSKFKYIIYQDIDIENAKSFYLTNPQKYFKLYDTNEIIDFSEFDK